LSQLEMSLFPNVGPAIKTTPHRIPISQLAGHQGSPIISDKILPFEKRINKTEMQFVTVRLRNWY